MPINRKNLGVITFPLSLLYGLVTGIRNLLFNYRILKQTSFPIPIISIGNITVGGTGKTPHAEYLIRLLVKEFKIALLSRGYKRKTNEFIIASSKSTVSEIGDEPKQIMQKFPDIKVAVSKKRVEGVEKLLLKYPDLNVIILDDAFQHRYIRPGLSILLIDYHRPLSSDNLLPFGDLRENRHEIKRAHIVIVTKTPENITPFDKRMFVNDLNLYPFQFLYFTTFVYGEPLPVFKNNTRKTDSEFLKNKNTGVLLVTGIVNPRPLYEYISKITQQIILMQFPDHYAYSPGDFVKINEKLHLLKAKNKIIITTEKDAVRISEINNLEKSVKNSLYYIPVEVKFLGNEAQKFNKDLIEFVGKKKDINKLHR